MKSILHPPKTSPLVDDELDEEEAIKKQTALAISTTEGEYISARKFPLAFCSRCFTSAPLKMAFIAAFNRTLKSLSVFIISLVIWERVHDFQPGIESYQQKVYLTAPTISFQGVEKHKMFSIIYEPVHGIIYKNSKKEKRVMRHSEIHKFCDATLIRVLKGLKSYNNDVKYDYVQRELMNDKVEYLKLFEKEIEVRLKYRNQMKR
ncbi:hypothetical protein Tco_0481963 [Tanacetum coccineum]